MRAKFKLVEITHHFWRGRAKSLTFEAEQNGAQFEVIVARHEALPALELGKNYYFDVTPAD